MTPPDAIDLITDACDYFLRAYGEPVEAIECAPDVLEALRAHAPYQATDSPPPSPVLLNGVPLIVMPAFPPGCYRLVRRMPPPPPIFDTDWWMTL